MDWSSFKTKKKQILEAHGNSTAQIQVGSTHTAAYGLTQQSSDL